ncbi:histidine kinase [Longicatena caecimuris]|uniref:histidine kinase n=1 Tax=Longicatena caecimuris TaxID=1796635 RepID=UPI001D011471|nr:histidine kinase [Longicatena caecimuris]MCB5394065.1 histidine kinase [Longicatena caecimuris]MCB5564917.1 histidine kinase [Longicatena caecimuris]
MKKLRYLFILCVFCIGCTPELDVTINDNIVIEYGHAIHKNVLIDAKKSNKNVSVSKIEDLDINKIGRQEVKVTFTDGSRTLEKQMVIDVEDTAYPIIKFKKKVVTLNAGEKYDVRNNIKTVKDPVDGDLAYSDKKTEKNGYYIDSGKLNTKKAGTYEVMVFAKDVNGNEAKESFKVVVKKKKVVRPVSEPTNNGVSNSNTSNVSGQSNNNNTNITNNTNKSNESNSTNKAPAKNDTSSSGNKTDKPSGNKKDDGKLCPLGKDPYKPCNAILNYKGGYGVYPTIEAAMDDGERLALDRKSPYWMKGFTGEYSKRCVNSKKRVRM